jgi:hypothetical protein
MSIEHGNYALGRKPKCIDGQILAIEPFLVHFTGGRAAFLGVPGALSRHRQPITPRNLKSGSDSIISKVLANLLLEMGDEGEIGTAKGGQRRKLAFVATSQRS